MNILITGASGFIGGRLANDLEGKGHKILATGRSERPKNQLSTNICYVPGSLEDESFITQLITGDKVFDSSIDIIIHCAGKAGVWGDFDEYFHANVEVTRHLLKVSKEQNIKKFINFSSPSIYFNFDDLYNVEETFLPKKFSNAYAHTKYLGEELVKEFHDDHFLTVNLRPRMVLGAGDKNFFPRLLLLHQSGKLRMIGDGQNKVSLTTIQNLFHAIDCLLQAPMKAWGKTYNIANAEPVKFWDLVNHFLEEMGEKPVTKKIPFRPVFTFALMNELRAKVLKTKKEPKILPLPIAVLAKSMTLNLDRAYKELSYCPTHNVDEAIKEYVDAAKCKENGSL